MSASRGSETLSVRRLVGVNYELVHLFLLDTHHSVQRQFNDLVLASVDDALHGNDVVHTLFHRSDVVDEMDDLSGSKIPSIDFAG